MFLSALPFLSLTRIFNGILWSFPKFLHLIHLLVFILTIWSISTNQVFNSLFDAIDMGLHIFCYEIFINLLVRNTAFDLS